MLWMEANACLVWISVYVHIHSRELAASGSIRLDPGAAQLKIS